MTSRIRSILHTRRYEAGRRMRLATISTPSGVSLPSSISKIYQISMLDNAKTLSLYVCQKSMAPLTFAKLEKRIPKHKDEIVVIRKDYFNVSLDLDQIFRRFSFLPTFAPWLPKSKDI